MGIRAEGRSWEEVFTEGAKAVFDLMIELKEFKPKKEVKIKCQAPDIGSLFVEWLNELIYQKDVTGIYFIKFEIDSIKQKNQNYQLTGKAWGEKLDPDKHTLETEVKAATYGGLECKEEKGKYYCQCVVDV